MKTILRFELMQLMRDKKTMFFTFVLPIIIFPLFNGGFAWLTKSKVEEIQNDKKHVIVSFAGAKTDFKNEFDNFFNDSLFIIDQVEENFIYNDSLLNNYNAFLELTYNDSSKQNNILMKYSSEKEKNSIAAGTIWHKLIDFKNEMRDTELSKLGVDRYSEKRDIIFNNIADEEKTKRYENSTSLPLTIVYILFFGTFFISNYTIVGERDNKTLETLLTTGVTRKDVVYGKLLMIILSGVLVSILELTSIYLYTKIGGIGNFEFTLKPIQLFYLLLLTFTSSIFMASLVTFVSTRIKSSTSAQVVIMPVMLVVGVMGYLGTSNSLTFEKGVTLVPILNLTASIKSILIESGSTLTIITAIVSSFLYSFFMLKSSINYLSSEKVLDTDLDLSSLKSSENKISLALISFLFMFVIYMLIGGLLQSKDLFWGLLISQVVILGGFSFILSSYTSGSFTGSFKFKHFKFRYLVYAIFFGLFTRFGIALFKEAFLWIFPMPELNFGDKLIESLSGFGLTEGIFLIAFLPAIFEELAFRGAILKLIEKRDHHIKTSIIVGLMFGFMHMNAFTILETSLLGIILTYLVLKSGSIFPAMIMHFTNNFLSVLVMNDEESGSLVNIFKALENSKTLYLTGLIVLVLIVLWFRHEEKNG